MHESEHRGAKALGDMMAAAAREALKDKGAVDRQGAVLALLYMAEQLARDVDEGSWLTFGDLPPLVRGIAALHYRPPHDPRTVA